MSNACRVVRALLRSDDKNKYGPIFRIVTNRPESICVNMCIMSSHHQSHEKEEDVLEDFNCSVIRMGIRMRQIYKTALEELRRYCHCSSSDNSVKK